MATAIQDSVAIVVIGRNEGDRLKACLHSVLKAANPTTVVYVDSGSVDGSPDFAASLGCHVVRLDPSTPFSAARARNEGFACAMQHNPNAEFVQFLDGDCELMPDWLTHAVNALNADQSIAIVFGYVYEIKRDASIYNMMVDLEWFKQPAEVLASGGRFMVRSAVFRAVGGFRPDVIAAEDDEFSIRVRAHGGRIFVIAADMAGHDVAIYSFAQWWQRARRAGHAYAHVAALHGHGSERYFIRECRRIWIYGLILPLLALCLAPFTYGISLLLLLCLYALQLVHIARQRTRGYRNLREAIIYSYFTVLFKFPALIGLIQYHLRHWRRQPLTIIEYKTN